MKRLQDKTIIVTGASSGFGKGIALACAQAGANVALVARRKEALEAVAASCRSYGVTALVCPADVADEAAILAAVAQVQAQMGPVDVLVNNAGTNVTHRSITDLTSDEWRKLVDVNLTSAFIFTKAVLAEMMTRESGTIINLASRAAKYPSLMAGVAYSSSKIAMEALTRVTNEEANPKGVRATIINPGAGDTPIMELRPTPPPQSVRKEMLQIEDLGETVVFVASLPPRVCIESILLKPTRLE